MFADRLIDAIKLKENPTVMGLDPRLDYVPAFIRAQVKKEMGGGLEGAAEAILRFNRALIDAAYDIVPAVKPQLAYYEMYGLPGMACFYQTVAYAKSKGLLVVADGKRNDIGSTATAYSAAFLGAADVDDGSCAAVDADALTVNPYLGVDGIQPFFEDCRGNGKGIFILVKTSNPSSGELQDAKLEDGRTVYERVASLVSKWGEGIVGESGYSSVGAVVGATYPEQAKKLREMMPQAIFLVPGYGAQGGAADDCAVSFNRDGLGAVVNASRSIMCAYSSKLWAEKFKPEEFAEAARAEAVRMRDDLNQALARRFN